MTNSYGFFTKTSNGNCETCIVRDGKNMLRITTNTTLSDEQIEGLYWIVYAMSKTGKTIKELIKGDEE